MKLVPRNLNESISFHRGGDVMKTAGIGIEGQIQSWLRERFDYEPNDNELIFLILDDSELEKEVKEQWVPFLLSKGYKWVYEEWSLMVDMGIDYLSHLPDGFTDDLDEITVLKKADGFYVRYSDWSDWSSFIETGRDLSEGFVEAVLSGDALEFFESDYHPDPTEFSWWISRHVEAISSWKDVEEKFIEEGGDPEIAKDVEEMIREISENPDFDDLKTDISVAISNAEDLANEAEAFKKITGELGSHFQIGKGEWSESEGFIAQIGVDGVRKLYMAAYEGEEKCVHYQPQYSYDGDISAETFDMELESRLSN
jgi:hypothetical protein